MKEGKGESSLRWRVSNSNGSKSLRRRLVQQSPKGHQRQQGKRIRLSNFFNPISFVRYLPGEKFSFFPSTFFESGKRESQEEASKDIVRERSGGRSKTRCRQISQVTSFPPFLMGGNAWSSRNRPNGVWCTCILCHRESDGRGVQCCNYIYSKTRLLCGELNCSYVSDAPLRQLFAIFEGDNYFVI